MGEKAVYLSKRKRKATLIAKCKEMVKKRKQSSEQSQAMESSPDLDENETMSEDCLEGTQETSPTYANLQNVLPGTRDNDNYALPCGFQRASEATTVEQYEENNLPPNMLGLEWASETTSDKQRDEENKALPYIVEGMSGATIQTEIQDLGHRIIDVNHFTTELVKISQHKSLFECGLATMKLVSENQIGLQSEFTYVCSMCSYRNKIKSSLADVNKDSVAGIMAAGCGHAQLKQFLAAVGS